MLPIGNEFLVIKKYNNISRIVCVHEFVVV